jgi:hypothetical protein
MKLLKGNVENIFMNVLIQKKNLLQLLFPFTKKNSKLIKQV